MELSVKALNTGTLSRFSTGILRLSTGLGYTNVPVQVYLIHLGTVIVGGWNAPGNGAENVVIALHILLSHVIGQI